MPRRLLENPIPLTEIAARIGGVIHGDSQTTVEAICPFDSLIPRGISFCRASTPNQLGKALADVRCAAVIVDARALPVKTPPPFPLVAVADPVLALTKIIPLFFEDAERFAGISPKADIHPSAQIGQGVSIGAFCVVGPRVIIADGVTLHPHVVLYPGVRVGARTTIHSGAVVREECILGADSIIQNGAIIGGDGFGYTPDPTQGLVPVPQVGTVVLSDRVDVGANSCIDRATLGETRIALGAKLDNLVQVGHNTTIGRHAILCGQVGIAGSSTIGDQVVLGGAAGVADHITITAGARFASRSAVVSDIPEKGDYGGHPAIPVREWNRATVALRRLGRRGGKAPPAS